MKEQNEIDQLFEDALGNLSAEPSAASWGEISSSLDAAAGLGGATATSNRKLYIYALIGTIAAILAYVFFVNQGRSRNITPNEHPVAKVKDQAPLAPESPVSLEEVAKEHKEVEPASIPSSHQQTSVVLSKDSKSNPAANKTIINKSAVNNESEFTIKKSFNTTNTSSSNNGKRKAASKIAVALNVPVFEEELLQEELVLETTNKSDIQNKENTEQKLMVPTTVIETQSPNLAPEEIASNGEEVEQAVTVNTNEEVEEEAVVKEKIIPIEEKAPIEEGKATENPIAISDEKETLPAAPQLAGTHRATGWSFDAFVGPAFINSNEKYAPKEGELIYQTQAEQHIISPNMGLNIKFHVNNWFIQSGIGYAEYGENSRFNQNLEMHDTSGYSNQNINQYYTYDTTGWVKDPNDVSVLIPVLDAIHHSDTTYNWITTDSLYYEHLEIYAQNRFRYIEIPAMIGYEFRFKNLSLELATGVSVGFRVNSSGKFLDSQNNLVDINPSNSPYSNTMMNYILSLGVKYHLSNRMSLIAQPVYKTNLNSIIKSGIGSDVRYTSYSINVGVNYIIK